MKKYFFLFLFFSIFISISFTSCIKYKTIEKIDNNIIFMTKKQTYDFLLRDEDRYVYKMSKYDLIARKVKSNSDYINKIILSSMDFNEEQKNKIRICVDKATKYLGNNIWKFSLTKDDYYEEGMPHTRKDIIFLSTYVLNTEIDDLTSTLIHEQIHIYQRYNKEKTKKFLLDNGYIIDNNIDTTLKRANPDIDDNIYIDPITKKHMVSLYKSYNPVSINDVVLNSEMEHPYEKIAYQVANNYINN